MKLSDFFAALFRWPRRKPQPEPDPDPVLPAESRRVEYGNDPMTMLMLPTLSNLTSSPKAIIIKRQ